jgi:myo-inositol-1(or 4)-monophosphatase
MNEQHLAVAIAAAKAGATELTARWQHRTVSEKSPRDLVTDADLAAQHAIQRVLIGEFADYAFVGEEQSQHQPPANVRGGDRDAPPCWVVDPLDGTINYVHRLQSFAVSIGLYAAGKMRLGVVYDPLRDELFTALDGQGACCNSVPIQVSRCEQIREALVAFSFRAGIDGLDPEVARFVRVMEQCQSLRRLGSCALNMCYVAAGRLDAYWTTSVHPWDSAAGTVIAREAGAELTSDQGTPLDDWNPRFCLSGSKPLQAAMLQLLNPTDGS